MMSEVPCAFTTDIKLEQSQKGVRISIHAYGNDDVKNMERAILLYTQTITKLQEEGITLAPIEVKG